MNDIVTPDQIVRELRHINQLADSLPDEIAYAESRLNVAEDAFQEAWDDEYPAAGSVAEREIVARRATRNLKDIVGRERVELGRLKALARRYESNQSSLQTQFKAIQVTYTSVGH